MGWRTLTEMLRLPTRREAIRTLCAGVLIAAICWYFGVDVWHAILLGCAMTVTALAVFAGTSAPDARDLSWRPGKRVRNDGSRNDVASLSSSLHAGWGVVGLTAERRLHEIARRRLALDGLDLQNVDDRARDRASDRWAGLPDPRARSEPATETANAQVLPRHARRHRLQPLPDAPATLARLGSAIDPDPASGGPVNDDPLTGPDRTLNCRPMRIGLRPAPCRWTRSRGWQGWYSTALAPSWSG